MKILFKVLLDLLYWGEARFGTKAELIVTNLTTAPMLTVVPDALFAGGVARADGITALADYKAAAQLATDGSKTAIKARNQKRLILEGVVTDWATVVEKAAKNANDLTILTRSGYDLRKPIVKPTTNGVPPAPLITLKRGKVSGSVVARSKLLLPHVNTYEGQYAVGIRPWRRTSSPG